MSLLSTAARRSTPMLARTGRQQARWSHSAHYDAFGVDFSNKWQKLAYYGAMTGALATPVVAVRYQLHKLENDKRRF